MTAVKQTIDQVENLEKYEHGFVTEVEQDFAPARKAHPALRVDDVDAVADRLAAAGRRVDWDDALPGIRRFYTADPWGNRVELLG